MKHIQSIKAESKATGFIEALDRATSMGETENGALTFTNSGSPLLDFFAQAGAMRKNPEQALELFKKAFSENRQSAIRILFYLRDVRGGQGERALFRTCLEWLGSKYEDVFEQIVGHVSEYGRWDDLFFDNEKVFDILRGQYELDLKSETPSLLAKWLPTINASSKSTQAKAKFLANKLKLHPIAYRKGVRAIRKKIKAVEEKMSARKWSEIEYSHVPSQAARIYRNAFKKHDEARYSAFLDKAETGEVKINAGTLYPYQIYKSAHEDYSKTLEALWNQLPDYTQGKNALVVADTSSSMIGDPMSVSVSLALYFAERNVGQFRNYFITFSNQPKLQSIRGETLLDRMNSIQTGEVSNTDLQKVFQLILHTALINNTPVEQMPETIYIISDMEFDSATGYRTNLEEVQYAYRVSGYKIPNIVFWNVDARSGKNLPARRDEKGITMVSGLSPSIFKIAVENKTPEQVMNDVINSERYATICLN